MKFTSMKKEIDIIYTKIWKRKEQEEEKVNKDHILEIARPSIVRERQGKQAKEEKVSRTMLLSKSAAKKYHNEEHVKEE
jgi:hypothetical protein